MDSTNKGLYHIRTYGCQMNAHDSEIIAGILERNGYARAQAKEDADVIVINTCCIRESTDKKIMGNIGALKPLKEQNRRVKIIVCGCMTQQKGEGERLAARFPFVDAVLGSHSLHEFGGVLKRLEQGEKRILNIRETEGEVREGMAAKRGTYPLSFVNVVYGCNNFCTYCIVPYVRGRERSRAPDAVVGEVASLARDGYGEVTLLGQNVNSYGKDLETPVTFASLLRRIDVETGMRRVRFMTSHPKDLSEELIEAFATLPSLCAHIHLPVQSGSDRILSLMNRRYTRAHYMALVDSLQAARPGIAVTTDIIAGFPGETEGEFSETLDLVQRVRFDAAYTFVYSKRSGTKAAQMPGQVPREIQSERIGRLIALQNRITREQNEKTVGETFDVLVESTSARDPAHVCGRTSSGKMVNFAGGRELIGRFVRVRISEAKKSTLFGALV